MARRTASRGVATVLILSLVSISMAAIAFAMIGNMRGAQEQTVTVNAKTRSEMKAWMGVDALRQYFAQLHSTGELLPLLKSIASGGASAGVLRVTGLSDVELRITGSSIDTTKTPNEIKSVTAQVTGQAGTGTRAQSSTVIEVLLDAPGSVGGGGSTTTGGSVMNFYRDVRIESNIDVIRDPGDTRPLSIAVYGDVYMTSGGTGIDVLESTGSIYLQYGGSFKTVRADCDILMSGSIDIQRAEAGRHFCVTGTNARVTDAYANGSAIIAFTNSGNTMPTSVNARAAPDPATTAACKPTRMGGFPASEDTNAGFINTCPSPVINGVDLDYGPQYMGWANTIRSGKDTRLEYGYFDRIDSAGTVTITMTPASAFIGYVSAGTARALNPANYYNKNVKIQVSPTAAPTIAPVQPVGFAPAQFDAYALVGYANYAFRIVNGYKKVTVKNVNTIPDGEYFVGKYIVSGKVVDGTLCTAVDAASPKSDPLCTAPTAAARLPSLCYRPGDGSVCIAYDATANEWDINAAPPPNGSLQSSPMPPGIYWFEGNLHYDMVAGNNPTVATMIATHNVRNHLGTMNMAINFAGPNGYVSNVDNIRGQTDGACLHTGFPKLWPTNLCTKDANGKFTLNTSYAGGIGNNAFMAGSWKAGAEKTQANYQGGNISLAEQSVTWGNVLAGNDYTMWVIQTRDDPNTSGGSGAGRLHGTISALAQGVPGPKTLGGLTALDVSALPPTFDPFINSPKPKGPPPDVKIKFVRFL